MTNKTVTIIFKATGEIVKNIPEGGITKAMEFVSKMIRENNGLLSTHDFDFMKSHLFRINIR